LSAIHDRYPFYSGLFRIVILVWSSVMYYANAREIRPEGYLGGQFPSFRQRQDPNAPELNSVADLALESDPLKAR